MPLYFPLRSAAAAADAGGAADWGPHQLAPHHPPACHLPLVLRTAHCVLHSPCSHRDGHPSPVLPRSGCLWSAACACVQGLIGPRPANVAWPPHYAMHLEPVAYHTQTDCRWNGCCWDDRRHQWRPPGAGLGAQEKGQRRCWPPHPWGRLEMVGRAIQRCSCVATSALQADKNRHREGMRASATASSPTEAAPAPASRGAADAGAPAPVVGNGGAAAVLAAAGSPAVAPSGGGCVWARGVTLWRVQGVGSAG
eukprot:1160997-Pelagomonas_calceolata.AAC.21